MVSKIVNGNHFGGFKITVLDTYQQSNKLDEIVSY